MKKVSELSRCLLSQAPELSMEIIESLTKLIEGYKLNWFSDRDGNGVYFLLGDLAEVEGMHCRSILKAWKRFKQSNKISNAPVCPKIEMLKGAEVKELRNREPKLNISDKCTNLNICNWSLIYAYKISPLFPTVTNIGKTVHLPEIVIQNQLALLSTFTPNAFHQEVEVVDITPSNIEYRRLDLVRYKGNEVEVYEIKSRMLTDEDISTTIGSKRYLELAEYHFDCRVKFNFVAKGISNEASQLLRNISNVGFISIYDLAHSIKEETYSTVYKTEVKGKWFYKQRFEKFSILN